MKEHIVKWLQEEFSRMGRDTAVIGISGGKDSAVVAGLLCEAIGAENVLGVLIPNGYQKDIGDSRKVVEELGMPWTEVNIKEAYDGIIYGINGASGEPMCVSDEAAVNIAPRVRMTTLYTIAQSLSSKGKHACVVGTGNKAEHYVGYFTKWGDGACDINPLQDLWVDEVLNVGNELGYFPDIIHKVPDDGLSGKTDEEKLGYSYDDVKAYATSGSCGNAEKDSKIYRAHIYTAHKENPIPIFLNSL